MSTPQEVLAYWLDEIGPVGWYKGGEELDAEIRDKFGDTLNRAAGGSLGLWLTCPSETLAYIIVTDQFSRNIHRGAGNAFETDELARAAAKMAIARDWDKRIDEPARQFFYMPLMHSENLCDQDRAVRLIHTRMPQIGDQIIDHAKARRKIIREFGRFPYRNGALGRETTAQEKAFLVSGGYRTALQSVQTQAA